MLDQNKTHFATQAEREDAATNALHPLVREYFKLKLQCPDRLVFIKAGDFYEALGDDAIQFAEIMTVTLRWKPDGEVRIPLAGFPVHAWERYVDSVSATGKKVALADVVPGTTLYGTCLIDPA